MLLCPCCGAIDSVLPFQQRFDINRDIVEIEICKYCFALINRTAIGSRDISDSEEFQRTAGDTYYAVDDKILESVRSDVDKVASIVRHLLDNSPGLSGRTVAIDVGAGRGFLAAAASQLFTRVYAVEIATAPLSAVINHLGLSNKIEIVLSLDEINEKPDAVFMWHTLEHIPNAIDITRKIASKMRRGGAFLFQVPMYRDDYVIPAHYTFFNATAARRHCEVAGLVCAGIWHDTELQFLTCLARKQ